MSGVSLIIDLATFEFLSRLMLFPVPINASISYSIGLVFSYCIFILTIFKGSDHSAHRLSQVTRFIVSGLLGSTTTYIVCTISYKYLTFSIWGSKLSAVVLSFILVYIFRIKYVFRNERLPHEGILSNYP